MAPAPNPRTSQAVLIGSMYAPLLPQLPVVERNVDEVARTLTDTAGTGLPAGNCAVLLNPATQAEVLAAVTKAAANVGPGGLLLIYLTGHAFSAVMPGQSMRFPVSGNVGEPRGAALSFSELARRVRASSDLAWLVMFDVCLPGDDDIEQTGEELRAFADAGGAAWLATSPQDAFTHSADGCSPFTAALLDVLRHGLDGGPAPLDSDAIFGALRSAIGDRADVRLNGTGPAVASPAENPAPWVMPGFAGEVTDAAEDLLGVGQDAQALATLMGFRKLEPPLAIGIHGEWGSGKTFFMKLLARWLKAQSDSKNRDYSRSVVNVWFNAWHYAEGNLWASLLHQIISELHARPSAPESELNAVRDRIRDVRETADKAEADVVEAQSEVDRATKQLELRQREERAAQQTMEIDAKDIWSAFLAERRTYFDKVTSSLGIAKAQATADDLDRLARDVRSVVEHPVRLATAGRWRSPLVVALLAAAVISIGGVTLASQLDWSQSWLGPATALIAQLAAVAGGAAAWIGRQSALVRWLLRPVELATQQRDEQLTEQREKVAAAEATLAEAASAASAAGRKRDDAETKRAEAQQELDKLTGPRLLSQYIADLDRKDEYGPYLGIAAIAHRDLKRLHQYLKAAVADPETPVDRIVLYIDDLDRCQPEAVVRVLEAVHLLLALPLFVVVVGVDAELLARSLRDRHPVLLGQNMTNGAAGAESTVSARDYLDKIFQLTYRLPPMGPDECAVLLRKAAATDPQSGAAVQSPRPGSTAARESAATPRPVAPGPVVRSAEPAALDVETAAPAVGESADLRATEILELSDPELAVLDIVAPLVGSTPRRAKRFLNVYRVTKARIMIEPSRRARLADEPVPVGLIVLVALLVGLPETAPALIDGAPAEPTATLGDWLSRHREALGADPTTNRRVGEFILRARQIADVPFATVLAWLPAARPFT